MTSIYFAHPVDYDTGDWTETYQQVEQLLAKAGAAVYCPPNAWVTPDSPKPGVQRGNLAVLATVDGMLAVWPGDQVSVGVPIEILVALQNGKRVALMTDMETSWVLAYLVETSANHLQLFGLDQVTEAVTWVMA